MQISAVGIVIQFWDTEGRLPRPAWMSMFIVFSEQAHSQRSFKSLLSSISLVCQSPVSHGREAVNWFLDFRTRGIRVFGEFEFWLSSIKVVTLIGMFDSNSPVIVANGERMTSRTDNLWHYCWYVGGCIGG